MWPLDPFGLSALPLRPPDPAMPMSQPPPRTAPRAHLPHHVVADAVIIPPQRTCPYRTRPLAPAALLPATAAAAATSTTTCDTFRPLFVVGQLTYDFRDLGPQPCVRSVHGDCLCRV